MQRMTQRLKQSAALPLSLLALALVGCNDTGSRSLGGSHDHDHDHGDALVERKIPTPKRVTQLGGHPDLEQFVAFATGNEDMYIITPEAGLYEKVDWSETAGTQRHQHLFDAHGEHLLILDTNGTLHVVETSGWSPVRTIDVISAAGITSGARMTVSQLAGIAFVTDPENDRIRQVDPGSGDIIDIETGFALSAAGIAWTGVVHRDDDHGHEGHEHEEHEEHEEHDHDHAHPGRLIVASSGTHAHAHIYDLDEGAWLDDLHLDYPPHAIHASPAFRYAVIAQRETGGSSNQVRFLDSGLWWHGDHAHADDPVMLEHVLYGTTPAHYRSHGGQAALFFDAGSAPRFVLFTDESLRGGGVVATENVLAAHHGIAEPRGEIVITSTPERDGVIFHHLHGDHFHEEGRSQESCPGLHGGGSSTHWSAFGCNDGVLLIGLNHDHDHDHDH